MLRIPEDKLLPGDAASAKLRGGYYTPAAIAAWLCEWCIRAKSDSVLEPSCGDGVFLESAARRLLSLGASAVDLGKQLRGVEMQRGEAVRAALRIAPLVAGANGTCVECSDFFDWEGRNLVEKFRCVVGNPPFIRYQNFPEPARTAGMELMARLGLRPNRMTNIWVPFVVGSTGALATGGRLAMVLPAELLQVSYAAQLRRFLVDSFEAITVVTCNELFFEGAEQEVVLVLAEGKRSARESGNPCAVRMLQFDAVRDVLGADCAKWTPNGKEKEVRHETEKWLKYFLSRPQIAFIRALRESGQVVEVGHHAEVDIGVVTGNNDFFVLGKEAVAAWGIGEYAVPLMGRSSHLRGAVVSVEEWRTLLDQGQRVLLLSVKQGQNGSLSRECRAYIEWGERQRVNTGYKCSIRPSWFVVPAVWVPDCFFFRQIHDFPRAVLNRAGATSTDTIHRMRCKGDAHALVSALYTHLTAASAEIEGRSYGGGVLELEPTEAERLLVPKSLCEGVPVDEIDRHIRGGKLACVLEENDRLILSQGLGLTQRECAMLKAIWEKMMKRRQSRRRNRG